MHNEILAARRGKRRQWRVILMEFICARVVTGAGFARGITSLNGQDR